MQLSKIQYCLETLRQNNTKLHMLVVRTRLEVGKHHPSKCIVIPQTDNINSLVQDEGFYKAIPGMSKLIEFREDLATRSHFGIVWKPTTEEFWPTNKSVCRDVQ